MKSARVKIIKDNIVVGSSIPTWTQDHEAGQWVDQEMRSKGHVVDTTGAVDMPEYGIDNKSRNVKSKAAWTIGSMTIENIIATPSWEDTRFYKKCKNQNQVKYNTDFMEISSVHLLDMEIDDVQLALSSAYDDVRSRLIQGDRSKEIKSSNGWVILDGYGHLNSYRFRIRDSAMKQIESLSATRDTRKQHFEGL
jgi:hypothetical protein